MTDETKHTPGPWVWRGKDGGLYQEGTAHRFGDAVMVPVYEYDSGVDTVVSEADMALIAAAPEMLDALREIRDFAIATRLDPQANVPAIQAIAEKAIAKAEGHSK